MEKFSPEQTKKYNRRLIWIGASPVLLVLLILLITLLSGLPNVETLANPKVSLASSIYSADGKMIGSYFKENRADVKFNEIPKHVVDALVATEDERFYQHSGVDFLGLFRAMFSLGQDGGGSTITQQLAKQQFTENFEKVGKIKRAWQKFREWIIACRLERLYTKEEIITLYLNQYDFLNQAVGIKSAALVYFNTTPEKLTIEQGAMLIGMLKNSSLFNPIKREEKVTKRREVVLKQMVENKFLTEQQYDSLRALPLGLDFQKISHTEGIAPYFREVLRLKIQQIFEEKDADGNLKYAKADGTPYNIYKDGLKIYTTLDAKMQEYGEWAVEEHLSKELQKAFTQDLKSRKKENFPFYNGISENDRKNIINQAYKQSDRYKFLAGQMCPGCQRPKNYIDRVGNEYVCNAESGGCGEHWASHDEAEIQKIFQTKVKTKVYTHNGPKDTLMSPMDSILYHKAILHASMMSMDPKTGHIKAWVGGIDYNYFKYDNVYQSRRQVGSTFKPIVYATALRMGKKPCDPIVVASPCFNLPTGVRWCPRGGSAGRYVMNKALAASVNTVAAQLISDYGVDAVVALARNLGIKSDIPHTYSIALGVAQLSLYEIVGANSAMVNHGMYIEPTYLLRIEDRNGNMIYEADPQISQALDPSVSYALVDMMKGVCSFGTASRIRSGLPYGNLRYPLAGKTGTTQSNTDGWFIGMTPDLVTGVWVGAQDPTIRFSSTNLGQGANTGLPIFGYFMNKVYADPNIKISKGDFPRPDNYDTLRFDCNVREANAIFAEDVFSDEGDEDLYNNGEMYMGGADSILKE
jgi:penicillin-binding protein 1A